MAKTVGKTKRRGKLIQSTFAIKNSKSTKCPDCGFEYISSHKESRKKHDNLHAEKFEGLQISNLIFNKLKLNGKMLVINQNNWNNEKIYCFIISCIDKQIIKIVKKMLDIANKQWLNDNIGGSNNWEKRPNENKVVLLISYNKLIDTFRIIGITTIDTPSKGLLYLKGYQMNIKTTTIEDPKSNIKLRLGISRIFVNIKYRRHHFAEFMLDTILKYGMDGTVLKKEELGFTQPSNIGCQLFHHWNRYSDIIPVYDESQLDQTDILNDE